MVIFISYDGFLKQRQCVCLCIITNYDSVCNTTCDRCVQRQVFQNSTTFITKKFNSHATCFNCCSRLHKRQLWRVTSYVERSLSAEFIGHCNYLMKHGRMRIPYNFPVLPVRITCPTVQRETLTCTCLKFDCSHAKTERTYSGSDRFLFM